MAQENNFIDDSIDRVQDAVRSVSREFDRLQEQAESRRKDWEGKAQKRLGEFRSELAKTPIGKRTEAFGKDATRQAEAGLETILGAFSIASSKELSKINRKLDKINKRLKKLEEDSTPSTPN